jgi:L-asparaginase
MTKPKIAVFSGPNSTIANSPTLVTSNKARLPGDQELPGRRDHLVPQVLYEPVTVRIRKYTAHPLEDDAKAVYHDDGQDFYEVELRPDDGPYPLPYMARRSDGSEAGVPFEDSDLYDATTSFGGRQFFYPDASRIFEDIDRTIGGRAESGEGSTLDRLADYDFVRALPPGGYSQQGERLGIDYFPYKPWAIGRMPSMGKLAQIANVVRRTLATGDYAGCIWLEGSPTIEETIYWLGLLIGTDLPIAGCAAQRPHGELSNDGDRNIVDAVHYILSGKGHGLGAVGVQDQQLFAAREFKKGDARPGGYKAVGGHGGILGTIGPPVTVWYAPTYRRGATSDLRIDALPSTVDGVTIKDSKGDLLPSAIPRVRIVKYGAYMDEDVNGDPELEVDILAWVQRGKDEGKNPDPETPKLHGFVMEGLAPYGSGSETQMAALTIAALSGMPVVQVGRSDPGGRVPQRGGGLLIEGSNLDANKARMLLMAALMKLGPLPKARNPRNPSPEDRQATIAKVALFQEIFESH